VPALIALTQADTVLAWDPAGRTLIAANLVDRMRGQSAPGIARQITDASLGLWPMSKF
jgi:hypothetical protein